MKLFFNNIYACISFDLMKLIWETENHGHVARASNNIIVVTNINFSDNTTLKKLKQKQKSRLNYSSSDNVIMININF